mmetsp:Transcript_30317/g.86710  ORF Transcript_30317/g.86710 Transcript_30317/m.86710 type:complete len:276 (-) Transcript_30317:142-969(-)
MAAETGVGCCVRNSAPTSAALGLCADCQPAVRTLVHHAAGRPPGPLREHRPLAEHRGAAALVEDARCRLVVPRRGRGRHENRPEVCGRHCCKGPYGVVVTPALLCQRTGCCHASLSHKVRGCGYSRSGAHKPLGCLAERDVQDGGASWRLLEALVQRGGSQVVVPGVQAEYRGQCAADCGHDLPHGHLCRVARCIAWLSGCMSGASMARCVRPGLRAEAGGGRRKSGRLVELGEARWMQRSMRPIVGHRCIGSCGGNSRIDLKPSRAPVGQIITS